MYNIGDLSASERVFLTWHFDGAYVMPVSIKRVKVARFNLNQFSRVVQMYLSN